MGNRYCNCQSEAWKDLEQIDFHKEMKAPIDISENQSGNGEKCSNLNTSQMAKNSAAGLQEKNIQQSKIIIEEQQQINQDIKNITAKFDIRTIEQENQIIQQEGDEYFSAEDLKYYSNLQKIEKLQQLPNQQKQGKVNDKKIRWREGINLGSGSFGHVIQGMNGQTGELMAVKQVKLNGINDQQNQELLQAIEVEIDVLKTLSHKNIVRYITTSKNGNILNIFLEYVSGGSMSSLIKQYGALNENLIRRYTKQILEGLEYLHSHKVIHRDIKGPNILVSEKGLCKLADFGSSKKIAAGASEDEKMNQFKGTANYMPPEVIRGGELCQKSGRFQDIWSIGCTLIEMATGEPPWSQYDNPLTRMWKIAQAKELPKIPDFLSDEAKDFIRQCLQISPHLRPNVRALLAHPFITGMTLKRLLTKPELAVIDETLENNSQCQNLVNSTVSAKRSGNQQNSPDTEENQSPYFRKSTSIQQMNQGELKNIGSIKFFPEEKSSYDISTYSFSNQLQLIQNKPLSIMDIQGNEDNLNGEKGQINSLKYQNQLSVDAIPQEQVSSKFSISPGSDKNLKLLSNRELDYLTPTLQNSTQKISQSSTKQKSRSQTFNKSSLSNSLQSQIQEQATSNQKLPQNQDLSQHKI